MQEKGSGCCSMGSRLFRDRRQASVCDLKPRAVDRRPARSQPTSVEIPGGRALLGTNTPIIKVDGEYPLRIVKVKPFRIDATAVTNAEFREFVERTNYLTEAERHGNSFVFAGLLPPDAPATQAVDAAPWWRLVEGASWQAPLGPASEDACKPDHPVVHVTWNDAMAFAEWSGGRLPSESEWEHAARGGQPDVKFPWGDREPDEVNFLPCNIWQGRFPHSNLGSDGYLGTAPSRSFEPNAYGLYNMVGNVWEWTSQPFRSRSLSKSARQLHFGKAGYMVSKGGSFLCHASYCYRYRIASRTGNSPDSSMSHQGFRLVYNV